MLDDFTYKKFFFLNFRETQREHEQGRGAEGERERERENKNLKQALYSVWSLTQGSIP